MAQLLTAPFSYFANSNGDPLALGKVYTYAAGTTTPQATYTNSGAGTPLANPVILDSAGRVPGGIWLVGTYQIVVKDSLDNTISTVDNVTASSAVGDMTKAVYDAANVAEQLVGLSASQTLTNKSLRDSTTFIIDDGDATKRGAFQASGITTATTRTYTLPDADGTLMLAYASVTNSLGADVTLNSTSTFFDGPSVAQGTTGTWFASGTVTLVDTSTAAAYFIKLHDGTTIIASCVLVAPGTNMNIIASVSGRLASPAGNIRISVKDTSSTSGKIVFNASALGKDSTLTAYRIA